MENIHPEISIIIVGYKSKKYLDACLKSIKHQTFFSSGKTEVIFINNGSFDGSIRLVQRDYGGVSTIRNMKNIGVASALNQGVKYSSGKYILVMSSDVLLEKDYLEKAYKKMERDSKVAAIMGKIYRYDFNQSGKTAYIDSVGIFSVVDREILSARGVRDEGQFEDSEQIFSVRNICAMYRKSALEDAKVNNEYFDESFFLYLEDVDLCWRLNLFGWKVCFFPALISYHCIDNMKKATLTESAKREKYAFIKNERLMTIKNEFFLTMIRDFWIILKKRFGKKSFFIKGGLSCYLKYLNQVPSALSKRKKIIKRRRTSRLEMRKWFIRKNNSRYGYYKSKSLYIYAESSSTY